MPILEVEIVTRKNEILAESLAAHIARAAGQVFGTPAGRTWVRLRELPQEQYAEDGEGNERYHPVFVTVLKAAVPPPDPLREETRRLAEAIAALCDRAPENIHLLYEPPAAGRIAFGGELYEP